MLWRRARKPFLDAWALPGGYLEPGETLEESIRRHLAAKVDVRELSHLEQLETRSDPGRAPQEWQLATAYLGLVPVGVDPAVPADTAWHPVDEPPTLGFDHGAILLGARARLRAKLSYTNLGFALAREAFTISELRELYSAALGHEVSATNLQRVLLRRVCWNRLATFVHRAASAAGLRRSTCRTRAGWFCLPGVGGRALSVGVDGCSARASRQGRRCVLGLSGRSRRRPSR
jgi:ADP-ribose pyrophosphatase YjhB (NUDIX family)